MARCLLVVGLITVAACTGSSDTPNGDAVTTSAPITTPPVAEDAEPSDADVETAPSMSDDGDKCDVVDRARLVRSQSIPGGHRIHLHVTDPDGRDITPGLVAECLTVTSERLGELDAVVSAASNKGGATLIVARWGPDDVDASRVAIDELLAATPTDERIAVWAWSDELLQVVGATTDRERITRRLDQVWTADEVTPLEAADAAEIASEEWEDFRDNTLLGIRSVVMVAPTLDLGERPDIDRDVVVDHWLVRTGTGVRVHELGRNGERALIDAGASLSAAIEQDRAVSLTAVDFCDDGGDLDLALSVGERELRDFGIGDAAVEDVGAACSSETLIDRVEAEQATAGAVALSTVGVTFDEAERAVFDEARAVADELSGRDRFDGDVDPEWSGSISFDGGVTRAPFEASFRGQSSIECKRRNWSVDLQGGDARHPFSGSGSDEFTLASLCNDAGYVNTLTGSAVMSQFGVWTQATGTGVFDIDGENRGVYLTLEDPDQDLRFETSRVTTVLRRRYDAIGVGPDLEYIADLTTNDEASILAIYDELLAVATGSSGDEMVDVLRARFDLDQYLRWTAVMSLLGSGDHIDELYFVGSESVDEQHEPIVWFTVNGWDPDDLFAPCHRSGRLAIDDPNGLLSCTESLLDKELFADEVVYELFVTELEEVIDSMTVERFDEITAASAVEVTRHFDDPATVAAMIELDPPTDSADIAAGVVQTAATGLTDQFRERRSALLAAVAVYRSAG